MEISYAVRIWKTETRRSRKTGVTGSGKAASYRVPWVVAGQRHGKHFGTAALADSFRSKLVTAAKEGEAFDIETGLPVSMVKNDVDMNWYDFACKYADIKWKDAAGTNRRSIAEGLVAVTVALLAGAKHGRPDGKTLRLALKRWGFNKKNRNEGVPAPAADVLDWVRQSCGNLSSLAEPDVLRNVVDALATKLDGERAAPNYFNRRRSVLQNALKYAVELKVFTANPIAGIDDKWVERKKARTAVDRRCVVNPQQAAMLLEAVAVRPPNKSPGQVRRMSGPRLKAFFGCLYYAALRPEEAVDLREHNLDLPKEGWGKIHLDQAAPDAGSDWTDTGQIREPRQLKHRGEGEGRAVPCPPQLTALLRWHLEQFGTHRDGRLFRGVRHGGPLDSSTYERVWRTARERVFTPSQVKSPLAKRPYDLRHAAVSTWLNAGVGAAQVAEWAGHSVKVLLDIYAKCIDGQEPAALKRIDAALTVDAPDDCDGNDRAM